MVPDMLMAREERKERRRKRRRGGEREERRGSKEGERMGEKSHIQTHFQDMLVSKKTEAVSLRTWAESLSWTQTKTLVREDDLYLYINL